MDNKVTLSGLWTKSFLISIKENPFLILIEIQPCSLVNKLQQHTAFHSRTHMLLSFNHPSGCCRDFFTHHVRACVCVFQCRSKCVIGSTPPEGDFVFKCHIKITSVSSWVYLYSWSDRMRSNRKAKRRIRFDDGLSCRCFWFCLCSSKQ